MNSLYKMVAILALVACGQSWAVGPGSQFDNKKNCNANLLLSELQVLKFGSFIAPVAGTVTVDPVLGNSVSGVIMVLPNWQPGIIRMSLVPGYTGTCSFPLIVTLPAYVLTDAVSGQTMSVSAPTAYLVDGTPANGATITLDEVTNPAVDVYVGGVLTAAAGQTGGGYDGSYTITISF